MLWLGIWLHQTAPGRYSINVIESTAPSIVAEGFTTDVTKKTSQHAKPSRGQMRSSEQQHAGQECPEHQADGDGEGAVDFGEIQPGQREDVSVLQRFGE